MTNSDNTGLDGFLSENDGFCQAIRRENNDAFKIAYEINRECHSLIFNKVDVRNRDGQALLVASLFLRALQHYQAAILLLEKGLVASAKTVIRAELEATFTIRAVAADVGTFNAFVNDNLRQRLMLMQEAKRHDYPVTHLLRTAINDKEYDELKQKVANVGAFKKKVSMETLSTKAGLHELYVSVYRILSTAVHSHVIDLDRYLVVGVDREIAEIDYAPGIEEVTDLLVTAADFVLLASDAVAHQFETDELTGVRQQLAQGIGASI